ncbi:MAG: GTPase domain-containing protein [Candidatus Lokiarchaeota archaeon]|jgi:signal recognition particle receptor subunit beta
MLIDWLDKHIQLKIVFYGPALSGKTTSIKALFRHFGLEEEIESIESSVRRTLFFDYGNISFQNEQWFLKIHIYSTTGQDFYVVTRPITLQAIDGIIFVADSQSKAFNRTLNSWNELCTFYEEELQDIPKIIAFNKQDLDEKYTPKRFLDQINFYKHKNIAIKYTIALNGEGILDSFEEILSLIFGQLYKDQIASAVH